MPDGAIQLNFWLLKLTTTRDFSYNQPFIMENKIFEEGKEKKTFCRGFKEKTFQNIRFITILLAVEKIKVIVGFSRQNYINILIVHFEQNVLLSFSADA